MNVAMRRVAVSSPSCFLCHLGLAFVAICSCNANVVSSLETAFSSNETISSSLPVGHYCGYPFVEQYGCPPHLALYFQLGEPRFSAPCRR